MSLRALLAVVPSARAPASRGFSSFARAAPKARPTFAAGRLQANLKTTRPSARFYASESSSGGSSSTLWVLLGTALAAGGGYYYYTTSKEAQTTVKSGEQALKAAAHYTPKLEDYQKVYNAVAGLLEEAGDYDGQWLPCPSFVAVCLTPLTGQMVHMHQ